VQVQALPRARQCDAVELQHAADVNENDGK
jgi:hypothetical protein